MRRSCGCYTGATALFVLKGAEPRTECLRDAIQRDARGYILTGPDVPKEEWSSRRQPLPFETGMPGVFAVGDARHGSVKRVASAVGEGSVSISSVHRYLGEQARVDDRADTYPAIRAASTRRHP